MGLQVKTVLESRETWICQRLARDESRRPSGFNRRTFKHDPIRTVCSFSPPIPHKIIGFLHRSRRHCLLQMGSQRKVAQFGGEGRGVAHPRDNAVYLPACRRLASASIGGSCVV